MIYKPLVAVVGPSGFGKSTSLRNLPQQTTRILDLERKGLPFPPSNFNVTPIGNVAELDAALLKLLPDRSVTHIVVDSFTMYIVYLHGSLS